MAPRGFRVAFAIAVLMIMATPQVIQARPPVIGDPAPTYLGETLKGNPIIIGDNGAQVMTVTFWASWCGPCRAELPILEGLQKVAGDRIRVVAVNIEQSWEFRRLAKSMSQLQLTLTHDVDGKVSAAYGVHGIPHFVLIGRDGRILKIHRGYDEKHLDQIVAEINAALAAK